MEIIKIIQNAWKYARKTILLSTGEYWQHIKIYQFRFPVSPVQKDTQRPFCSCKSENSEANMYKDTKAITVVFSLAALQPKQDEWNY